MKGILKVAAVAALGLCATTGCGNGRPPVYPVSGKVTWNSQPAKGAMVVFHPVTELPPGVPKPRGTVTQDGTLEVTTFDAKDGAPAGEYKLTVEWWLSPGGDAAATNRLGSALAKPESSNLKATVEKGQTTLEPIELKR